MGALPDSADVVVVGGGITGASTAYHLARRGLTVVLLERSRIAAGPTGRSTAIVRVHYSQPRLVEMALHGLAVYSRFDAEVGWSCGFVRSGVLWLVAPHDRSALEANVSLARDRGADIALLEPEQLGSVDERVSRNGLGGAGYEPGGGHCDPYLAAVGFVRAAAQRGAQIVETTRVLDVGRGSVDTEYGRVAAGAVVVAAGPWSAELLEPLGYRLPLAAARAEVGRFRLPADFGPPLPAVADLTALQFYVKSAEPGYLEVGTLDPSHADDPVEVDACPEGAELATLRAFERSLGERVPASVGGHWRGAWSGVYDVTPDWQPAVGPVPGADGVFVAAGFSGHGFKLAPAVGAALADLITDGRWSSFDLSLFDPARFERGELLESRYGYSVVG